MLKITFGLVLLLLTLTVMSGCMGIGEIWAIRTVDDVQQSKYHVVRSSALPTEAVTKCMMQTLYSYKSTEGTRPYAEVATRNFGSTFEITLRTRENLAT